MYHEGNIQSGIILALRESKHVVCLVRDDAEGSSTWEEQYLADEEISSLLEEKAVVLKLNAGSQEAGFLSSYCPVGEIPTLVVIKDGKLLEYLTPNVTAEEFKARLTAAFEDVTTTTTSQAPPARQQSHAPAAPTPAAPSQPTPAAPPQPTPTASSHPTPTVPSRSTPARGTLAAPNPQARPSEQDPEAQRRESIRAGKRPAARANDPEDKSKPEQDEWKRQQRKMEQQQREEKQRVLDQIKQDNIERQQRDENRKATAMMRPASLQPLTPTRLEQVRLQVRLLDGSSIRKTFLPANSIRHHVRPWVDEQRSDGTAPYTLKQILAPHPNRSFTTVEESQTLEDLKLGPTANLILVPLKKFTDAYPNDSTSSLARGIYAGYEFLFNLIAALAEIFATLVGIREAPSTASGPPPSTDQSTRQPQRTDPSASGSASGTSSALNVRTLRDQRDERDEFYNGNQLNFQPRSDLDDSE